MRSSRLSRFAPLVLLLFTAVTGSVMAANSEEAMLQEQLNDVEERIAANDRQIQDQKANLLAYKRELSSNEMEIEQKSAQIEELERQIEALETGR